MASAAVVAAVKARIAANWTRAPLIDFNLQGTSPADGSPFLTVQYPAPSEAQITIGSPGAQVFRERGVIRFVLSVQRGQGLDQALVWLDELRTAFRAKKFDGVNTFAPSPAVLNDSNDIGSYWVLSSVVEFYADSLA